MRDEPKTPAQRERERMFALRPGESWHRGARVRRTPAAKPVNPRRKRK